ncbi:hypothetical protein AXG55_07690 [Silvanigrella aquatica]|uniref:Calcineurin-like phosphoesterase domain-containing protein n=2 Tax=Silvanigrella aquatica TaxID=1915309 RepID=A0A1L4D4M1_9BACT|nr:hypothetical protein AXG55_07690 [Silvanigrella aquatica]
MLHPKRNYLIYISVFIFMIIVNAGFWGMRYLRWQGNIPENFYYIEWISYTLLGFMFFLLTCFFVADVLFLSRYIFYFLRRKNHLKNRNSKIDINRRSFLQFIALGCASIISGIAFYNARKIPDVKKVFVPLKNLHPDLRSFQVVQLTDFHIGQTIGLNYVEAVVERVNSLNPDVIVITGDLVDGFVDQIKNFVAPLGKLKAKYGVYYVTGNHEYYWDSLGWIEYMKSLGSIYLGNENRSFNVGDAHVVIGGLTDLRAENFDPKQKMDPEKSIVGASSQAHLKILLAHQPNSAFEAAKLGFYHLQISGHTHGGQFWPGTWLIHLIQSFRAGLTMYENMWVYVSRGTGYWGPPARLGSDSEITQIFFTNV